MGGETGILVETYSAFRGVYVKKIFARFARGGGGRNFGKSTKKRFFFPLPFLKV